MTTFNSPHWLSDAQIAAKGIKECHFEMFRRYYYQQAFGVEKWYSKLLDLTFRTAFAPLEPAEVLSILRVHKSIISRDSFLYKKHVDESELRDIQVPESDSVSSTLHEKLNLTVIIGHLAKPREEDTSRDGQNGRERRSFY